MINWLFKRKRIKDLQKLIEYRWSDITSIYSKWDIETMDKNHSDLVRGYKKLQKKILNLKEITPENIKTELDLKSYYGLQYDLFKEIFNSDLIYQFDNGSWTFESPYRTLKKMDQSLFGTVHCTHILYPSEEGVGGTKGYFTFLQSSDGESISIKFVERLNDGKDKLRLLFQFNPYVVKTQCFQYPLTKFCLEHSLPSMSYDVWDLIMLGMGSGNDHLKKISNLSFENDTIKMFLSNRWSGSGIY